jgi:hypothetical protein
MTKRHKILTILGVQGALFFSLMTAMLFFLGAEWYWIFYISLAYMALGLMLSGLSFLFIQRANNRAFEQKMKAGTENEVVQTKTVEIDLPRSEAYDLCLDALKTLDNIPVPLPDVKGLGLVRGMNSLVQARLQLKLKESKRDFGMIHARLKGKSFGFMGDPWDSFIIKLQIEEIDANTSRVHIESRPRVPTVVFDFGMDLHFVNAIALYLRQESRSEARLLNEELLNEKSSEFEVESKKLKVES